MRDQVHPVDSAIRCELAAIKRDIARNPEDPMIDVRLAALNERSAARELEHRRQQARERRAERDRVLAALRQDVEAKRFGSALVHSLAFAFVLVGQMVDRAMLAVVGFHITGGIRGVGQRRGWWR